MSDTTRDALDGGALVLEQPARGYRFNVDSVHLAGFAARRAKAVVDLGAGVGTIGLLLARRGHADRVVLVERDPKMAELARRNLAATGVDGAVVEADVEALGDDLAACADLVVCNPPYFPPGSGRPAQGARRDARSGALEPFVRAARQLLARRGRACFVYPARDWIALASTLRTAGLEPKRAQFVHARASDAARVVLVECAAGKQGGLVVEPPIVESV